MQAPKHRKTFAGLGRERVADCHLQRPPRYPHPTCNLRSDCAGASKQRHDSSTPCHVSNNWRRSSSAHGHARICGEVNARSGLSWMPSEPFLSPLSLLRWDTFSMNVPYMCRTVPVGTTASLLLRQPKRNTDCITQRPHGLCLMLRHVMLCEISFFASTSWAHVGCAGTANMSCCCQSRMFSVHRRQKPGIC